MIVIFIILACYLVRLEIISKTFEKFEDMTLRKVEFGGLKWEGIENRLKKIEDLKIYSPKKDNKFTLDKLSNDEKKYIDHRAIRVLDELQNAVILWVDDHPAENDNIRLLLQSMGVTVYYATTTREALEMLKYSSNLNPKDTLMPFNLIISDLKRYDVKFKDKYGVFMDDIYDIIPDDETKKYIIYENPSAGLEFAKSRKKYGLGIKIPLIIHNSEPDKAALAVSNDKELIEVVNAIEGNPVNLLYLIFDVLENKGGRPKWLNPPDNK
ncbi:hypothetical protein [Hymenobacter tenuis]